MTIELCAELYISGRYIHYVHDANCIFMLMTVVQSPLN
ncbi:hypothetical protein SHPE106448_05570 [Shewanella pealeana]